MSQRRARTTCAEGQWYRSYGNEMWEFDGDGLMARRYASINDLPIREDERRVLPGHARGTTLAEPD